MAALTLQQQHMNAAIAQALRQERALEDEASSSSASDASTDADEAAADEPVEGDERLPVDGHRPTMNLERRLYRNLTLSPYFKSLLGHHSFDALLAELASSVTHLGAWCGVSDTEVGEGSPAYCVLLRLHQVGLAAPQLDALLRDSNAYARGLGLLYVRFTQYRRVALFHTLHRCFGDPTRVFLDQRHREGTTLGEFAKNLLRQLRYQWDIDGTIFPRMPVETANEVEQLLGERLQDAAPLQAPKRKRPAAGEEAEAGTLKAEDDSSSDCDVPQPRFLAKRRAPTDVSAAPARSLLSLMAEDEGLSFKERWALREQQRQAGRQPRERSASPVASPTAGEHTPPDTREDGARDSLQSRLDTIKKLYGAEEAGPTTETPQQRAQSKRALAKKDSLAPEVLRY